MKIIFVVGKWPCPVVRERPPWKGATFFARKTLSAARRDAASFPSVFQRPLRFKSIQIVKTYVGCVGFSPFLFLLGLIYSTPYDSDKPVRIHDHPGRRDERSVLGRYYWPVQYDTWWRTRSKLKHVYEYDARTRSFCCEKSFLHGFVCPSTWRSLGPGSVFRPWPFSSHRMRSAQISMPRHGKMDVISFQKY